MGLNEKVVSGSSESIPVMLSWPMVTLHALSRHDPEVTCAVTDRETSERRSCSVQCAAQSPAIVMSPMIGLMLDSDRVAAHEVPPLVNLPVQLSAVGSSVGCADTEPPGGVKNWRLIVAVISFIYESGFCDPALRWADVAAHRTRRKPQGRVEDNVAMPRCTPPVCQAHLRRPPTDN
jgi:hypothetical protein